MHITSFYFYFKIFIAFTGLTLVNKIKQVSTVQFYNISSVYCIMCSSPKVKFPSITIYLSFALFYLPHPPFPLVITILLSVSMSFFLIPSPFSPSSPIPLSSDSCQSVLCIMSLFRFVVAVVSLFCSLDSTYGWNHRFLSVSGFCLLARYSPSPSMLLQR